MSGARIQLKRSTAASWTSNNPVLYVGEIGYETDTKKFKIGDGSTAWTSLTYSSIPLPLSSINDLGDVTITSAADGDFLRWNGTAWINDAVNLSTDTVGSYVASLVAGTGITLSNNSGEAATPTVAVTANTFDAFGAASTAAGNAATALTNHEADTTNIHGIADTSILVTTTGTQTLTNKTITSPSGLVKGDVGLGNVDNTSNATERAATATLTNKTLTSPVINTPTGIVKGDVGLGSVDNTADTAKPVSTAQQTALDLKANLASPTFTGTVTVPAPTNATDAATKAYADAIAAGINWHESVELATATTLPNSPTYDNGTSGVGSTLTATSNGRLSVDGVNATTGDRILVKDQATATQNGIYVVTAQGSAGATYLLTRATDHDGANDDIVRGDAVYVGNGSSNINQGFLVNSVGSSGARELHVVGTDNITFTQFTGTSNITAGTGITKTGNTLSIGQSVATDASVTFTQVTAALVGNASTATTLATARNIAGQSFNGSANISIAPTDLTGVTSSAAELNILDGATLSTTELNYVDGVTSAIQTQIDLKAPLASPTFTGTVTVPTPIGDTTAATKLYVDTTASTTASNASTALSNHEADTTNIHGISDTSILVTTTGSQTLTNKTITSPSGLVKGDVGLGNADNTADTAKPVSTAQQTALDLKAPLASPTFTGTVTLPSGTVTSTMIVDDTIVNADINASAAIVDTKLATISTAGKVSNSATTATDANTASAIVARDASGNFTAGTVTAALTGNASTATTLATARNIAGQSFNGSANISIAPTDLTGVTSTAAELNILDGATLTVAELNYVDGVTSAIQTQIDAKAPLASPTFTGTVVLPDNTVALGTKTTGDYVATITGGTGVTSTAATTGEGTTHSLSIGQAVATTDNVTFAGVTADNIKVGVTASNEIDTASGDLTIDSAGGTVTIDDNLTVTGNLTVSGTTTSINTETLTVDDNIIVLNNNATGAPSANAGIEVERGSSTNVALRWNETSDKWELTEDGSAYKDIATEDYVDAQSIASLDDIGNVTAPTPTSGDFLKYNGSAWVNDAIDLSTDTTGSYVASLTAGTGVTLTNNSGEGATPTIAIGQAVGTGDSVTFVNVTAALTGNASTATTLATTRAIEVSGDVTGTANFDGSAAINIVTTIAANSVALGTDTTGNYVNDVTSGTGITVTHTPGEGSSASVAINATLDQLSNVTAPSPTDGQFLKYVAASSAWEPAAVPTINTLDDVGDVTITGASSGQFLKWNGSAWVNDAVPIISNIDDITGVTITAAADKDFLMYNGSAWVDQAITLGTDTTGNYMTDVSAGTGISITHTPAEGSTATIALADVSTSAQTASYTLVLTDKNKIVEMNVASGNNLTVPPNSSVAFPVGSQINILQVGAGQTTVVQGAGVTVNAAPGLKLRTQWSYATLIKRAENTWVLVGDISA